MFTLNVLGLKGGEEVRGYGDVLSWLFLIQLRLRSRA